MKRIAVMLCTVLGLAISTGTCHASWGSLFYSGYQPWWNICAKRYKCLTPEEERLQKFWHDYYDAMKNFYCSLDAIDWVAYYKNHGYPIGCGPGGNCGPMCGQRVNYAPVFVSPVLQWAVPNSCAAGPPMGPPMGPPAGFAQAPMFAPPGGMMHPMAPAAPAMAGPHQGQPGAVPGPGAIPVNPGVPQ